jgi:hypothetical protein
MRWIATVAALLLALAGTAHAQIVYKCVGKSGKTEYSSWPCKPGQITHQAISAPPEPVRRYVPPPRATPSTHGQVNYFSSPTEAQQERAARDAACHQAKRERETTLARVGLKRTFDLLRRLDDNVRSACVG